MTVWCFQWKNPPHFVYPTNPTNPHGLQKPCCFCLTPTKSLPKAGPPSTCTCPDLENAPGKKKTTHLCLPWKCLCLVEFTFHNSHMSLKNIWGLLLSIFFCLLWQEPWSVAICYILSRSRNIKKLCLCVSSIYLT